MSANNWSICPRCKKEAKQDYRAKLKKATDSYGKVDADQFRKMIMEAKKPIKLEMYLREDYEQGINDDGVYSISYHANCQQCNYEFHYKHEEQTEV